MAVTAPVSATSTVVSAPGKVLLAGGYLILETAYSGTVVSTSSRFYSAVLCSNQPNQVVVRSPQFIDAEWKYAAHVVDKNIEVEADPACTSTNKFVHLAIQKTLALALEIRDEQSVRDVLSRGLAITIVGDNDFYSQRATLASMGLPATLQSLSQVPAFAPTNVPISQVHKTGLGSSAALITSLTTALLIHFGVIPSCSEEEKHRHLAHNLAQYIHCFAQGKVGSGFDVSAAVFGSQVYTRFNPSVLQDLMNGKGGQKKMLPKISPDNGLWTHRVGMFKLPPLTRMMLADVNAGSDTPSLVKKVLAWKKNDEANANKLWNELDNANQALSRALLKLSELYQQDSASYEAMVNYLATLQSAQWLANPNLSSQEQQVLEEFYGVRQLSEEIRAKMRDMGKYSDTPIEPPEQTRLLDACISVSGVIGGGVPGAGGYDAIWLLIFEPRQATQNVLLPVNRVESLWTSWTETTVSPLLATERTTAQGVRLESLDEVVGLRELVHI